MWFQIFFIFNPKIGEDEPILTNIIFQMGWFNHHLATFFPFGNRFFLWCKLHWDQEDNIEETEIGRLGCKEKYMLTWHKADRPRTDFLHAPPNIQIGYTWKAKCTIFKAIVAGFRGKVA